MRTMPLCLLLVSCNCGIDSDSYVPQRIGDPEMIALAARYGLHDPHWAMRTHGCRMMDGRGYAFTARTVNGQLVEGSFCGGVSGLRIELK